MTVALDSTPLIPIAPIAATSQKAVVREASVGPLLDAFDTAVARFRDRVALRICCEGAWRELTYGALREEANRVASWLIEQGTTRGSTIALVADSSPEWTVALLGGMMAGAIVVPIDAKLAEGEIAVLLAHAGAELAFVSRATEAAVRGAQSNAPRLARLVVIDDESSFAALRPRRMHRPLRRDASETALIVYTSGTTGNPKGVETTFGNLHFEMVAMDKAIGPMPRERFLSVLPLNHLYELICGLFAPMNRGATICYSSSLMPDDVARLMQSERITTLTGVPLLFRALKRAIERQIRQRGSLTQTWFSHAMAAARFVPSHSARRALFAPVLRSFGPELRVLYSGGAALDAEVATFFDRLGTPIYQGYGLSETSPVVATNTPESNRIGSVGRTLEGVEIRIVKNNSKDPHGEIQTRGPHVMSGYLREPELTREVITSDGWFKTGDLGFIDHDGYLFVTGRSKDVIVLGGGKKVYPDEVEDVLARSTLFKEVCVVGAPATSAMARGFDEVCAVIVPDDSLAARASDRAALEAEVHGEVAARCEGLAAFKRPTRIVLQQGPLPKTATRKLKRPLVLESIRNGGAERI